MSIIDVLEQDTRWLGQDGFPYLISEMEQSHRINVLRFLERRAGQLYRQKAWRDAKDESRYLRDAPDDVWMAWENSQERALPQDPIQWLTSTPCVKALVAAVLKEGAIPPDMLVIEGSVLP
jgi:hypothetical protein